MNRFRALSTPLTKTAFFILSAMIITASGAPALFAATPDQDLMNRARAVFGPLPASMPSPENPITPEKAKLGSILYWESRISVDGTVSCAKCHPPGLYAADGLKKAVGNHCKDNPRNSPCILNSAAQISEHWIGNRVSVEDQAKQALIGPPSYGMPSYESVEKVLKGMKAYVALFKEAFPGDKDPVTADNFAKAVGAFERTLVTPAAFDDFVNNKPSALSAQQKRGLQDFLDTGCMTCHFGPFFGGQMYQKFGVFEPYWNATASQPIDEGRFAVTKNAADKYLFKVPILRNVAETKPYFHDGSVEKLEDAVTIMARIQLAKELSREQAADIAAFLKSLTGTVPDSLLKAPVLPAAE